MAIQMTAEAEILRELLYLNIKETLVQVPATQNPPDVRNTIIELESKQSDVFDFAYFDERIHISQQTITYKKIQSNAPRGTCLYYIVSNKAYPEIKNEYKEEYKEKVTELSTKLKGDDIKKDDPQVQKLEGEGTTRSEAALNQLYRYSNIVRNQLPFDSESKKDFFSESAGPQIFEKFEGWQFVEHHYDATKLYPTDLLLTATRYIHQELILFILEQQSLATQPKTLNHPNDENRHLYNPTKGKPRSFLAYKKFTYSDLEVTYLVFPFLIPNESDGTVEYGQGHFRFSNVYFEESVRVFKEFKEKWKTELGEMRLIPQPQSKVDPFPIKGSLGDDDDGIFLGLDSDMDSDDIRKLFDGIDVDCYEKIMA